MKPTGNATIDAIAKEGQRFLNGLPREVKYAVVVCISTTTNEAIETNARDFLNQLSPAQRDALRTALEATC